jgi:hypothetical protein
MKMLNLQKPSTGLEIGETSIKLAQILRGKRGDRLIRCATVPFPEETLKLSYKTANINDPHGFLDAVKEVMAFAEGKISRVGLSLPNEIVKVAVQKFGELPKTKEATERMIAWWAKKNLPFPTEGAKISYHPLTQKNGAGEKRLMVAIAFEEVIREYENNLKEVGIHPEVIRPAGINHFNFYHQRIPPVGVVGFLGLFEHYLTLYVIEGGELMFYHGIKRGYSDIHFFQDVEMTLQLYLDSNPDKEIDTLCYGSQVGFHGELEEGFRSIVGGGVVRLEESAILSLDGIEKPKDRVGFPSYVSAVSAAQSLTY